MTLFILNTLPLSAAEDLLLPRLTPARREIVLRRSAGGRINSACAELLLYYALRETGYDTLCKKAIDWNGKPHFADADIPVTFNLSHSGNTVAVLLSSSGQPCGVDVEEQRTLRNPDAIAAKLFTDAERAYLAQAPVSRQTAAFYQLWTAKEASVKYTGEGFSRKLSTVCVDPTAGTAKTDDGMISCSLFWSESEHYILCAAAETLPAELPIHIADANALLG